MIRILCPIWLAGLLAVAACADYKPRDYVNSKELNDNRPGLFSGRDGAFTIYSVKDEAPPNKASGGSKRDR